MIRALAVAMLAMALSGATALAEPDGHEAAYREAYTRGRQLFDQSKWAEAREQFEKAYELEPRPLLLFNIGSTYRREGNYIEALFYYHRYLEEAPADAEYRTFARKVIADLNAKIEADKAAGKAAKTQGQGTDRQGDGHKSDNQKSDGQKSDGQQSDGQKDDGQKIGTLGATPGRDDRGGSASPGLKYTGMVMMVVGVAGLGWGGYEAYRASHIADDLDHLPMGTPWTPDLQSEYERGQAADTRARISLAAGGAVVVVGSVLYLIGRRSAGKRGESRSMTLAPQLAPQSIGVTVGARF